VNSSITELRDFHEGLNHRQLDTVQTIQEMKRNHEATSETLNKLAKVSEQRHKDNSRTFTCLSEHINSLEAMLGDTNRNLQKQADSVRSVDSEVQRLKTACAQFSELQHLKLGQTDLAGLLASQNDRTTKLEQDLGSYRRLNGTEMDKLASRTQDLEALLDSTTANFTTLKSTVDSHDERLGQSEGRLGAAEGAHKKLSDQVVAAERQLRTLNSLLEGALSKLDVHSTELERISSGLNQNQKSLDATRGQVEHMRTELRGTMEAITKLSSRMDLCHNYFQGLSKGFQDTHRQVAKGESGMLQPKSTLTGTLPVIPPRTPRGTKKPMSAQSQ